MKYGRIGYEITNPVVLSYLFWFSAICESSQDAQFGIVIKQMKNFVI